MIEYLLLIIILFVLSLGYFKIADKYNIIDKPNHRSAHTEITLRGGGVIFWFSALIYTLVNYSGDVYFFLALTIMCGISFWDDIKSLPNRVRIIIHFLAISIIFYKLNLFQILPIYLVIAAYVFFIGTFNAYNFMDGINGITGVYSIVVLASLLYVNNNLFPFVNSNFIIYPIVASVVFLFFNFRKRAKCFAGDIGSMGIAFWIVFLLIQLMLVTESIVWVLFLIVYGVDTGCTIIHRMYLRENIFIAHRHHFYQVLSNDYKVQHRLVALIYGFLQLLCTIVIVKLYDQVKEIYIFLVVIIPLMLLYTFKFYLLKKNKQNAQ